jgi:magnesium-transporting ATPase (P-type)
LKYTNHSIIQVCLILFVITLNTWIGIMQEGSAEKAADALKSMLSSEARVIRNGKEVMIPGDQVVPGEVVALGTGDKIPADMRMFKVSNMASLEAALTGEAVPIDKTVAAIPTKEGMDPMSTPLGDRHNMVFSATLIAQGSGLGIAIATGDFTEIGTINSLVSNVEAKKTNVLEQIDTVSKYLAVFIMVCAVITWLIAFFVTKLDAIDSLSTALTCAVAMIPEGLEAIVTLVYAWAVSNMAKQNAIIRALPAVETLGSVTVICSDKTGTLTKNEMSLVCFVVSDARYKNDVDAASRQPGNMIRDDGYLALRAKGVGGAAPKVSGYVAKEKTSNGAFAEGESPDANWVRNVLVGGVLCSHCVLGENGGKEGEIGNPTEISILRAAYFAGIDIDKMKKENPIHGEVPFSSEYKFMTTVHEPNPEIDGDGFDGKYVVYAKGAPDRMLAMCNTQAQSGYTAIDKQEPVDAAYWTEQIEILSSHGLRCLAITRGTVDAADVAEGQQLKPEFINGRSPWMTMVGLCAIQDPPRPECVQAIIEAHGAGVRVIMITGDHKDTAVAIGDGLGIVDEKFNTAVTGPELDNMSDEEIMKAVMITNVFARASPNNKIQIVKALQAQGQIASMTGDGVNDAPALKAADMGVAMGKEGTDVAREAAEMILADDNFATIVVAVREGRVVWDNLRKVLLVNTPINNAQGLSVLFGLAFGLQYSPLSPIQVLYSNLICAVTLGFVCAVEPAEDGIMEMPPRIVGKRLIGRYLFLRIALGTFVLTACVVGSTFISRYLGYSLFMQRAQAFNTLNFGACSVCISARFAYNSAISPKILRGNAACWYSVLIMTVLQLCCTYIPGLNTVIFTQSGMNGIQWGITAACALIVFLVMEAEKGFRRVLKSQGKDTDDREKWLFDRIDTLEARMHKMEKDNTPVAPLLPPQAAGSLRGVTVNK